MTHLNFKRWSQALVLTSLLAGCGGTDSGESAAHEPVTSAQQHCVMYAMPFKPGEPLPASDTVPEAKCFSTFPDAISFATGGTVRLPATATPANLEESDLKQVNQAAPNETVIGIEYMDGYSGSSLVIVSTFGGCGTLFVNLLGDKLGFNDQISSSKSFAGCNHSYHYENFDAGGAQVDCHGGCTYIGDTMNDRTSSIFWTQ
jgi:hypothetical protein